MKGICLLFSLFFYTLLVGQEIRYKDDTVSVQYSMNKIQLDFNDLPYKNLDGFQHYRPFGSDRLPIARSGNNGLPTHLLSLLYQDWDINANLGGYQAYLMKKSDLKFYRSSRPFTLLRYSNGAEAEQLFSAFHTQNLGEGLNISLEYRRTVSEGFFQNQQTNHTQFNATYNLKSRNQRFESRAYFYINDLESQENGGINAIDVEEDNTVLINVNLTNAQNQSRSLGYAAINGYDLIKKDSSSTLLNVSHELNWDRSNRVFKDQVNLTNPQYDVFFLDSNQTADSSYAELLSNQLNLNLFNKRLSLGYRNEQYQYFQNFLLDEELESHFIVFQVNGNLFGREILSNFEKGISGFHEEALSWKTRIGFINHDYIKSSLDLIVNNEQPDYFIQNQRTNQHFYEKNLETSNYSDISLLLEYKKWNLSAKMGFSQYENYIFYDSSVTPLQLDESFNVLHFNIEHRFKFLKYLNFKNNIYVQNIEEEDAVPLPSVHSYHSFYFERPFFNEALSLQTGFDYYYIDSYQAYAYSPALTQFHINNRAEKAGGNGQLDFFLNLRIERAARLFVKIENILNEEFSSDSFRIQNYPIPGRVFKIGFSWRMIN